MENTDFDNFHFELQYFDEYISFREVTGFHIEMKNPDDESIPIPLPESAQSIVLKRAVPSYNSQFVIWCGNTVSGSLGQDIQAVNLVLHLKKEDGTVVRKWIFYKAFPVKYTMRENLIESVELSYYYSQVIR